MQRQPQPTTPPTLLCVHPLAIKLVQHFDGWFFDFTGDDSETMWLSGAMLTQGRLGDLESLVESISTHDLMCWNAWSPATGVRWNPFRRSYEAFKKHYPDAQPLVQPCTDAKRQALRQFFGI